MLKHALVAQVKSPQVSELYWTFASRPSKVVLPETPQVFKLAFLWPQNIERKPSQHTK